MRVQARSATIRVWNACHLPAEDPSIRRRTSALAVGWSRRTRPTACTSRGLSALSGAQTQIMKKQTSRSPQSSAAIRQRSLEQRMATRSGCSTARAWFQSHQVSRRLVASHRGGLRRRPPSRVSDASTSGQITLPSASFRVVGARATSNLRLVRGRPRQSTLGRVLSRVVHHRCFLIAFTGVGPSSWLGSCESVAGLEAAVLVSNQEPFLALF
jgi:hypothetical protein